MIIKAADKARRQPSDKPRGGSGDGAELPCSDTLFIANRLCTPDRMHTEFPDLNHFPCSAHCMYIFTDKFIDVFQYTARIYLFAVTLLIRGWAASVSSIPNKPGGDRSILMPFSIWSITGCSQFINTMEVYLSRTYNHHFTEQRNAKSYDSTKRRHPMLIQAGLRRDILKNKVENAA